VSRRTTCHAEWLALVGDILQGQATGRDFPHEQVADLLMQSFDAACCSLNSVDGGWVDHVVGGWPDGYLPLVPPSGERPDATTHPLIRWYAVTGSSSTQYLGRVPRGVAPAPMVARWSEFARPFGITHQIALPLRVADGVDAYVVSRPDDDYDDGDAELGDLIRPSLAALARQHLVLADVPECRFERAQDTHVTERELAVLTLLGSGLTAAAIARRLRTSPRTVHKHLEHLYRKLGVRDRLMAVQRARDAGLLAAPADHGRGDGTADPSRAPRSFRDGERLTAMPAPENGHARSAGG
jgi:DNA-binding CsgD family transcriptional regulator